ncbi:MAG: hypothetical protein WC346_21635 [Methanogenium sp.]|jgi:hypothetical protein
MINDIFFQCPCECDILNGGFCKRHGISKSKNWVNLCRTDQTYWNAWEAGIGPKQSRLNILNNTKQINRPKRKFLLGDNISFALSTVGITEDRVTNWLGRPCGCGRRREKLNQLDIWARDTLLKTTKNAKSILERLIEK